MLTPTRVDVLSVFIKCCRITLKISLSFVILFYFKNVYQQKDDSWVQSQQTSMHCYGLCWYVAGCISFV